MTRAPNAGRWPSLPMSLVGLVLTVLAVFQLDSLRINGDLYGLLGEDDEAVMTFRELSDLTIGLEELLIICHPGTPLTNTTIERVADVEEIRAFTRSYSQPGKSSLFAFALTGDPADYRHSGVVVRKVQPILDQHAPGCGMAGTPPFVVATQERLNKDLLIALGVALVLITLLFAFIYRIGWLALAMLVPVGAGIAWGLAAYSLFRSELTLLAAAVPTLLIGIGVDHSIHMIQAVRHAMADEGLSRRDAVMTAWRRLFKPITLASVTTTVTFAALAFASLQGFADFGLNGALVSAGVYFACVGLLPAILLHCPEKWFAGDTHLEAPLKALARWIRPRTKVVGIVMLALTIAAAVSATNLEILSDVRKLEVADDQGRFLQARIAREYGLSASPILIRFDNNDDAIEFMADVDRPDSIASLVDIPGMDHLVQIHTVENPFIRANYQAVKWDIENQTRRLELGGWQLSGAPAMNARIDELLYADIRLSIPLAAGLILLVLAIGTRSGSLPFLVLLPLVLSIIWLAGAMAAVGVAASVVTAAIIPIVLGIGVDGGVHLLAAWRRHDGHLQSIFGETGLAIVVTIITSMTAFGAFMVAASPSLAQFGAQATFALFGCLVVTLWLLPVILRHRFSALKA